MKKELASLGLSPGKDCTTSSDSTSTSSSDHSSDTNDNTDRKSKKKKKKAHKKKSGISAKASDRVKFPQKWPHAHFRQIPICPSDYNLVAFTWKKQIFCDTVLSMGCRSSAYLCQRITNSVGFIMFKIGILVLNYLDDLASAETKENALFAYNTLSKLLQNCGIEEAKDKSCPPCTVMTFIGVLFNTESMAIEITPERLVEIKKNN